MDGTTGKIFENLDKKLSQLILAYRGLFTIVRLESQTLIESNLDQLKVINQRKAQTLGRIQLLEKSRMKVAEKMAAHLKMAPDSNLSSYIEKLDPSRAKRLHRLQTVLERVIRKVSERNKTNQDLAESALRVVSTALESVRDIIGGKKPTYHRRGDMGGRPEKSGNFVKRQV